MRLLLLLIVFILGINIAKAQESLKKSERTSYYSSDEKKLEHKEFKPLARKSRKVKNTENIIKIGYMSGFGSGQRYDDYNVSLFMPEIMVQMWQKGTWTIDLIGQPQYNVTFYEVTDRNIGRLNPETNLIFGLSPAHEKKRGFEFGLNVGWILRKSIYKDIVDCYFLPSIGPHYISGAPLRQSTGFIFSDNLYAGVSTKIKDSLFADVRVGFRHISNADTVEPNRGINSYILLVGFYYIFQ